MQVFKTFLLIAKKHLGAACVYLGIFIVLMLMMSSNATNEAFQQFHAASLDICVIDLDDSNASHALIDYLDASHEIVTPHSLDGSYQGGSLSNKDKEVLQDNLYYQSIDYVLTIEKDFESRLLAGETDRLVTHSQLFTSCSAYLASTQITEYIHTTALYLAGGFPLEEALEQSSTALTNINDVNMIDFNEGTDTVTSTDIFYYFQYLPYVLLSMLIIGLTPVIIKFNQKEVRQRTDCSALPISFRNAQIMLGCVLYSAMTWVLFLLVAALMYGTDALFSTKGYLCILNSIAFLLITVALTLFLSTVVSSMNILNMLSNVIGLGMSFLCGIFVPQWLMGDAINAVARFLPAYWYVKSNNMISGFSGEYMSYTTYWQCLGIQLAFAAALFALFMVSSKIKRQTPQ